jgi:SAM-dependent methyltransferase
MSTPAQDPRETAPAFDAASVSYDEDWESLPATRRLRRIVHGLLDETFPPGSSILEVNAGTGTDALYLARRGVRVLATDIAPRMVEMIAAKAAAAGVEIETAVVALNQLDVLGSLRFDGVLSDMGGLNCIPDLRAVAHQLARLVVPGGAMVLGFMPDFSLWETAAFSARGRWGDALRRRTGGEVIARVAGHKVPIWYHAPSAVAGVFSPWFTCSSVRGVNVVSPPPGSARMARNGGIVRILDRCDDILGRVPPFSRMGDHAVMILRRTGTPAPQP